VCGALASTGRFLALIPGSYLKFNGKRFGLKALPKKLPTHPQPVGVVTLKNRTLRPVAHLFIEHAREVATPLAKSTRGVSR
jgi:DNA-binding transcriptional LysR family regulator